MSNLSTAKKFVSVFMFLFLTYSQILVLTV